MTQQWRSVMSEIQAEGLSTAATNPDITNDSKNIAANGGEESSYTKHRFNETPSEAYGSGSSSGFLSENAKNPKDGSDWLGGPQNGSETPSEAYVPYGGLGGIMHNHAVTQTNPTSETPRGSTEGAYQQN